MRAPVIDDSLIAAAEAAVDVAGAVIRPYFRAGLDADLKDDASPVTIADRAAEQAMRAMLSARHPAHAILGEEFGETNAGADWRWVLDPIDGTRAFITGRPTFGTLVGLLHQGVPVLGIVDQPVTGERWIGVAGQPTRFRGPLGGNVGVRGCARLDRAELSCTSPEMFDRAQSVRWNRLASQARRRTFGGDCYAYSLLALGQIDIVAEAGVKIWDWAALVPVIEGAGGRMTDWSGNKLRDGFDGTAIAVGDPGLLEPALRLLAE